MNLMFGSLGLSVALALAQPACAGGLSGEFAFEGTPPSVALIYFTEDHSLANSPGPIVDQKDKKFAQKLLIGHSGCRIRFNNSDSVEHNIYANDTKTGTQFDAGLVPPGEHSQIDMTWKENTVVKIGCKIHPKMQAYIANISSAHYKVVEFASTQKSLAFALENVPDKFTKVRVWFPKQDAIETEIHPGESKQFGIAEKGLRAGVLNLTRN